MTQEELLEYDKLKNEQGLRITARDNLLNFNLVALGVLATVAIAAKASLNIMLLAPWISAIFGWAYVQHEQKITSIGRYLRDSYPSSFRWEEAGKYVALGRRFHGITSVVMIGLAFAIPCIACPILWFVMGAQKEPLLYVAASMEIGLGLLIGTVVIASVGR